MEGPGVAVSAKVFAENTAAFSLPRVSLFFSSVFLRSTSVATRGGRGRAECGQKMEKKGAGTVQAVWKGALREGWEENEPLDREIASRERKLRSEVCGGGTRD